MMSFMRPSTSTIIWSAADPAPAGTGGDTA
jgi:hypothetical protein